MDKLELQKSLAEVAKTAGSMPNDGGQLSAFAELIVEECVQLCQECIDDGCVEAQEPMVKIQKHFGVKE